MEIDYSLNEKSNKSHQPKTAKFDKTSFFVNGEEKTKLNNSRSRKKFVKPILRKKLDEEQFIAILKSEKSKKKDEEHQSKRHEAKFDDTKNLLETKTRLIEEAKIKTTDQMLNDKSKSTSEYSSRIFLQRMNDNLCFERHDRQTEKKLIGLIDLGLSNNFILKDKVKHGCPISLTKPIQVLTKFGKVDITHYVIVNLFSHPLKFLIIEDLGGFDLSLGMNGLRDLNAKIDFMSFELFYTDRNKRDFV